MTDIPRYREVNSTYGTLKCPTCGSEYLHHDTVTVWSRSEDNAQGVLTTVTGLGETSVVPHADMRGCPSLRRHSVSLNFWCEDCHVTESGDVTESRLRLDIMQHKGMTLLQWRVHD